MHGGGRPRPGRAVKGLWLGAALSLALMGMSIARAEARTGAFAPASATSIPAPTTTTGAPTTTTTVPPPTTTSTVPPTTTTTAPPPPPPPPPTTTTTAAPAVPVAAVLPARGQATAWGCTAALAYLRAYADPSFELVCPGDAQGHQAVTCIGESPCAPGQRMIGIADPCPAAYMNEAHNSWVLDNEVSGIAIPDGSTAIDPFGYCH